MLRKSIIPSLAILGIAFGVYMVVVGQKKPPIAPILFPPATSPYSHAVAGAGIIEAVSENIEIGTPFNEIVVKVHVKAGDCVLKDTPLFELDTRTLEARLEEVIKERERAITELEDQTNRFSFYQNLHNKDAVSKEEYDARLYALLIAQKQVEETEARILEVKTTIERSTIRAPIDGQVLQISTRVGQTADINPFNQKPLVLFGAINVLQLRVDVDESEAWRIQTNRPATAFVRGNSSIIIPLEFNRIEPYVIPKRSLTADNQERVDTRVLQILYRFNKGKTPVYVGQLLDVFIESLPATTRYHETPDSN
jgi:RND family efflux transporter MFP subunit